MTVAGKEDGSISGYRSEYDKESETASAGYYSVMLSRYGVKAESTATERCGVLRFTFPENPVSRIQVDLARRVGGTADEEYLKVVDDRTIQGWIKCSPDGGGWGDGERARLRSSASSQTLLSSCAHSCTLTRCLLR